MIAQILDIIKTLGSSFAFWVVVDPWEAGVILRLGNFNRKIGVGMHFKIPFIENAIIQNTATTTTSLSAQSIVAPDGIVYTVEGVVKWSVSDIRPFACDIWDSENVIIDSAKSAMADVISKHGAKDIGNQVATKSRIALRKYGIAVDTITITTLAPVKCFRLITDNSPIKEYQI
jgi:regulator of protease activity HflC (stomatin/prohibitin superfamily)